MSAGSANAQTTDDARELAEAKAAVVAAESNRAIEEKRLLGPSPTNRTDPAPPLSVTIDLSVAEPFLMIDQKKNIGVAIPKPALADYSAVVRTSPLYPELIKAFEKEVAARKRLQLAQDVAIAASIAVSDTLRRIDSEQQAIIAKQGEMIGLLDEGFWLKALKYGGAIAGILAAAAAGITLVIVAAD